MSTSARMIVVLTVITTLVGGLLAGWDSFTSPKIEQHRLERIRAAVEEVLPPHDQYEKVEIGGMSFYVGKSSADETVGIAFQAVGTGFQGEISMMVGVDASFAQITGVEILSQVETPGLGTKIVTDPTNKQNPDWFTDQFKDLKAVAEITAIKNQEPSGSTEVQAITGATISSKAVVDILNTTLEKAKDVYQSQKEQVL